jgi:hypothetical protein
VSKHLTRLNGMNFTQFRQCLRPEVVTWGLRFIEQKRTRTMRDKNLGPLNLMAIIHKQIKLLNKN